MWAPQKYHLKRLRPALFQPHKTSLTHVRPQKETSQHTARERRFVVTLSGKAKLDYNLSAPTEQMFWVIDTQWLKIAALIYTTTVPPFFHIQSSLGITNIGYNEIPDVTNYFQIHSVTSTSFYKASYNERTVSSRWLRYIEVLLQEFKKFFKLKNGGGQIFEFWIRIKQWPAE